MASLGRLALSRLQGPARNFSTTAVARSQGWQQHGVPGSNLPFDINNRYKMTIIFTLFFGTANVFILLVFNISMKIPV
ncbi:hypothetical protein ScPMuIL_002874 [Solemya velum]